MKKATWYIYMIATTDGKLYTGITTDIERRWQEHCGDKPGGAKFFRSRKPSSLVYLEDAADRSTASKREAFIKQLLPSEKRELVTTMRRREKQKLATIAAKIVQENCVSHSVD